VLARLLLGGVAWLVALLLFAALIQWSGSEPRRIMPALDGVDARSRAFNSTRLASSHPERERWTVTRSAGFLTEMVITVVAERPEQARTIAEQIVLPVASKYQEVLVYVRALDEDDPLVRRVDWTPRGGFVEMAYRDTP
jgi:hypothetical protein